jgi:hypothetical protein
MESLITSLRKLFAKSVDDESESSTEQWLKRKSPLSLVLYKLKPYINKYGIENLPHIVELIVSVLNKSNLLDAFEQY